MNRLIPALPGDRFAILFAAAIVLFVALVWRHKRGPMLIALAAFLPAPIVALFSKQFDLSGWHGFMHASPIYQIMERGGFHPEEPLYAGGALRYPWVEHWITAKLAVATGISAHVLALSIETVALAVFLLAIAWLASSITTDRVTIALSMLVAIFGVSFFHMSFFLEPLTRALPSVWLETRVVAVDKFLNVSAMPIGYAAMALAAAAGVRFATGTGVALRLVALIAVCTLVSALVHPLSWVGVLVWQGSIGLVLLASRKREDLTRAVWLAAGVGIPSVIALPYLRAVGASESSDGWSGLTAPGSLLGAKAADLLFYLVTVVVFVLLNRDWLRARFREHHRATIILVVTICAMALAYLVVRTPGRNEYKFLLHMTPAVAVLIAVSLRALLERHRVMALALVFVLLIPGGRVLGSRPWFLVTDPVRTDGPYLRALDADADALYQWVAHNTPPDAVFIASDLRVPPLGRRSLYVAVDAPWRGRDGWGLPRTSLLQWHVRRPDAEMYRRQRYATVVLNHDWQMPPSGVMSLIGSDVPGRALYVHASWATTIAKLNATPGFRRVFANAAGAVYAYGPDRGAR